MNEFEAEYEEDEEGYLVSRRVIPADFAVIGLGLVRDLFSAFETALSMSQVLAAKHANFVTNQRLFRQQAVIEIETLTTGDEDG